LFIGINVIVFLVLGLLKLEFLFSSDRQTPISSWLSEQLTVPGAWESAMYKPWTAFTYMFAHEAIFHFIFNMLVLYWFGQIFEDFLNGKQFIFLYIVGGLFGGLLYLLFYNSFPAFEDLKHGSHLIGASGSIMAIVVATATFLPDYSIRLLLFGDVRLKYLALAYVLIDVISIAGSNAGGSIAHLGGALLGFIFIKQLQAGNDWSKILQKRRKLKVVSSTQGKASRSAAKVPEQELIDEILDKISKSGYESLTSEEKEQLFKASSKE
jgi:membrane associated rhomboid family serine protease